MGYQGNDPTLKFKVQHLAGRTVPVGFAVYQRQREWACWSRGELVYGGSLLVLLRRPFRHMSSLKIPLHRPSVLLLIVVLTALASGCLATFGPQAVERTHPAYNEAIIASINEQMLQNLVRMRYRDVTFFLEIGSVTTSLSLQASAGVDAALNFGTRDSLSPGVGLGYADNPTISYTPLQGENLLKSILSPLQLEAILVLTQSGWKIDRVFGLCFERINNLYNAPNASGPTPQLEPDYEQFNRLLESLHRLQRSRLIEIGTTHQQGSPGILVRLVADDVEYQADINRIYELLQLDRQVKDFDLSTDFLAVKKTQWAVRTRSISGLLYYLSQTVETPEQHQADGLVTVTTSKTGGVFDWTNTPAGRRFKVRAQAERPDNAYIATYYRGHWFYIEDTDLESKSTFMLLRQLFDLQAGQTKSQGPTLTLPVR